MKTAYYLKFSFAFLFSLVGICAIQAQKKALPYGAQPDLRFVVTGEMSNSGGDEYYNFYVLNTTDEEYRMKIKVTLNLACLGRKEFFLGYTGWVYLKPRGKFGGDRDDNSHIYMGNNVESLKGCVLKDENGKPTFFNGFTFHITEIQNMTVAKAAEAKRIADEQLARQRSEEERKKLVEEKRKADELARAKNEADEKKKREALARQQQVSKQSTSKNTQDAQQGGQKGTNTSVNGATDDFWTEKKTVISGNNSNANPNYRKLPEVFYTTNGQYWKKKNGEVIEINKDEYLRLKSAANSAAATDTNSQAKPTALETQQTVDKIMTNIKAKNDTYFQTFDEINRKYDVAAQSGAMQEGIKTTKAALNENSSLRGDYQNVEQLMEEYRQKMNAIRQNTNQLNQQRTENLNYVTGNYYSSNDYAGQMAATGVKVIGTFINAAKASKERKEAAENLKYERELAEKRIQEREIKLLSEVRTDLFKRFKEASFPTSTAKIEANTLYFFTYSYDPSQIGGKQAVLYISNVFQVDKYSDDTWPFKNSIIGEISKLTPYTEVLHGYYSTEGDAENMRKSLIEIFKSTGGTEKAVFYQGKKISGSGTGTKKVDFWEN